jgi:hypothetical protein
MSALRSKGKGMPKLSKGSSKPALLSKAKGPVNSALLSKAKDASKLVKGAVPAGMGLDDLKKMSTMRPFDLIVFVVAKKFKTTPQIVKMVAFGIIALIILILIFGIYSLFGKGKSSFGRRR